MRIGTGAFFLVLVLVLSVFRLDGPLSEENPSERTLAGLGDADLLKARYATWTESKDSDTWVIPLGRPSGHTKPGVSQARVLYHPADGRLTVIADRKQNEMAVWLVDNLSGPNRSSRPEAGDDMIRLGLTKDGGLEARLDPTQLSGFEIDLIVLTPPDGLPQTDADLIGSPSLFQRLRAREASSPARGAGIGLAGLFGKAPSGTSLSEMVEQGERLFLEETFAGNGRTCGTCHRPENNFTIDPAFIATLPADDPLFVGETNPALNFDTNGGLRFEHPAMMREFGLIVANVDGMDDLANTFTLRGVPHTLGMSQSLTADLGDGTTAPPDQRTGWSGDGAPGSGTLREFATGAVIQHFPQTLDRAPGIDFRLPTDDELDAMAAFQLSLGRQEELDLGTLELADPVAAAGLEAFVGPAKCNTCHVNAGANFFLSPGGNRNFDTGVERFRRPRLETGETPPRDGGFGTVARNNGGFGDGTFNTPSLVESADTEPFFHNNSASTLEEAIRFYNTRAFNNSPAGVEAGGIRMNGQEIRQIARFLRVINALENIRESHALLTRVSEAGPNSAETALARASEEIEDAIRVGSGAQNRGGRQRRPGASALESSLTAVADALEAERIGDFPLRDIHVGMALAELDIARSAHIGNGEGLAVGPTPGRGGNGGRGPGNRGDRRPDGRRGQDQGGEPSTRTAPNTLELSSGLLIDAGSEQPRLVEVQTNYPNPFNPQTTIPYQLSETTTVELAVFDVLGQRVRTLVSGVQGAGAYTSAWDGRDASGVSVPSGTYLYRLSAGGQTFSKSMLLLK